MARSVPDVAYLLSIMAWAGDARDQVAAPQTLLLRTLAGAHLRIRAGWCPNLHAATGSSRARGARNQRHTFETLGCIVEEAHPDLAGADDVFLLTLRSFRTWINYGSLLEVIVRR